MKFLIHLRSALLALTFVFITGTIRADIPPLATTLTATSVSTNNATLNGTVTGGWTNAVVWFQYGLSTNYGQSTAPMIVSATNATTIFSQTIVTGVVVGTNYHFRVVATNSGGIAYGRDLAFNHLFVQSSTVLPNVSTRYNDAFSNPSAGVCDYDNDGDFDILLSGKKSIGSANSDYYTELLRNDGNGTFTPVNSGLAQVGGSITSGDFDNDNLVDALVLDGRPVALTPTNKVVVYHNNGNGTFSTISNIFPAKKNILARAADFNNDGRLDFTISDRLTPSGELSGFGLWHNNNKGAFILWPIAAAYVPVEMAWGDFDNDDDLDLVTSYWDSGPNTRFQLIRNNGDETFSGPLDGSFGIGNTGYSILSVVWGDFNNDGWLDLFYVHNDLSGFLAPAIMLKGDGSFFLYTGASLDEPYSVGIGRTVISADIDNDGYRDFLISASNPWVEMYHNNGDFSFTRLQIGWTGGTQNASSFGDFNGDGKLDVLITHFFGTNAAAEIWLNNTAISNTPPTAPTGLVSAVSNGVVRFSWSVASDAQNTNAAGLSYNLRVGTTPGGVDVMSPCADPVTGKRRILDMGNTQMGLTGLLRVGPGRYYWSVQAIDAGLAGGPFAAEQSFYGGGAPQIETVSASATLNGSATLHSTFYPGELATTVYFQYGPTISYGQSTPPQPVGLHGLLTFQQTITGLAAGIYHYRVVATNSAGVTFGADQIFENINLLGGDGNNDGLVDAGEVNRALSNYWSQSVVYMTDPKRLTGGLFQFALTNMAGWNFNVQGSSDLNNWTNLPTTAAPVYQFADADGTNAAPRYYRLR